MSQNQANFERTQTPLPSKALPDSGLAAEEADEAFLRAARLAERRVAEVAAAMVALNADEEAVWARLEKRLSQRYEQLRERLLLSSTETLEALDRALDVARVGGADSLVAEAAAVRFRLAAILQDEGCETPPAGPRPNVAVAAARFAADQAPAPIHVSPQDTLGMEATTLADSPVFYQDDGHSGGVNATLVVADAESLFVRPVPRENHGPRAAPRPSRMPQVARPTPVAALPPPVPPAKEGPPTRPPDRRGLSIGLGVLGLTAIVAVAFALRPEVQQQERRAGVAPVQPRPPLAGAGAPVQTPSPPEIITIVARGRTESGPTAPIVVAPGPVGAPLETPTSRATAPGVPTAPITTAADPSATRHVPAPPVATSVADLMAQGAQALASKDYDKALARYAEVLANDPGHAAAATETLRAKGGRAALGRFFETQATVRDVAKADEKQCEWGPCAKARVLDCKLEYAITPPVPVQGEAYRIDVTAVNTGEKNLKVQSPTALMFRSGEQGPHPLTALGKEIARGEKKLIARIEDVWTLGTTSWWLEVTVKDQKGDSYRAQFTWELPRTLSR